MASLTKVSYYTRRSIVIGIIFLFLLIISKFAFSFGLSYWKEKNPPISSKPTVSFGKLTKIKFPENKNYPKEFELQTIEGRPPTASISAKVFFIPKKNPMLFSRKKAIDFALNLKFNKDPKILNSTIYEFNDQLTGNILTLDITNKNFLLKINYLNSSVFQEKTAINKETAVFLAKKYFSSLGVWDEDLTQSKVSYFKFEGQNLVETKKQKEMQIVRVDFSRQEIDGIPVLPLKYDKSGIYIIFSGNSREIKQVLEARFYNFPPNLNTNGTYPLISGKQAWENLKNGKAYIAKPIKEEEKVIIRKIYLAYLEMPNYQPYLQPIFVFEGDKGFVGFVTAINPFWIGN